MGRYNSEKGEYKRERVRDKNMGEGWESLFLQIFKRSKPR